jgi:hypothetical protein
MKIKFNKIITIDNDILLIVIIYSLILSEIEYIYTVALKDFDSNRNLSFLI